MPPWLRDTFPDITSDQAPILAARLVASFVLGWLVVFVYERTSGREVVPSFRATLLLLTILIAAVTQVIGDNVARAFSLVGALSIVRFRTVVQDTRDIAFVIFAVTVGMAVGAGHLWVAVMTLIVVGVSAAIVAARTPSTPSAEVAYKLSVTVAVGESVDALLKPVFDQYVARSAVTSMSTAAKGSTLEMVYEVSLLPGVGPSTVLDALTALAQVQLAQLKFAKTQ